MESVRRELEFGILGLLEVLAAGEPLVLGAPKERALLALLLVHRNVPVASERLVEELWAGRPPARAVGALQVYVSHLRRLLEPGRGRGAASVLRSSPSGYLLAVEEGGCDVDRFLRLYEQGVAELGSAPERAASTLNEALAVWRGPALADFVYERWAQAEIGRLEELRLVCTEARVEAELAGGRHAELVGELDGLIGEQPLRERLRGQLMLALYRSGRQAEALEAYQQARAALVEELGIEPSRELQDLNRAILNQEEALAAPARVEARRGPIELPLPPTPLIGRQRELAELEQLLAREDVRLLTLTGPGGIGKTRLAVEVARACAGAYPDGVSFVGLAPLYEAALVLPTIAQAVEASGDVAAAIAESRRLLVLDNFEHLLDAATGVAELLARCPNLDVIATSRAPLHVAAEHEHMVPGLACPDAELLFAERARAVRKDFTANGEVTEICERLDGLPLAIELAAARVNVLSPAAIRDRLDHRLALLTTGARDAPERHQTLRATIEWSYELLGPNERVLLARLAVFAGGFTLEAAETVCDADLDTLASLLDKSLIGRDGERFTMLETIREYAAEQLEASGDANELRGRQAAYVLELAERADKAIRMRGQSSGTIARVEAEHDNARAALAWLMQTDEREASLRLATALGYFWSVRGYQAEGRFWLNETLHEASSELEPLRVKALRRASWLALDMGDFARAGELQEEWLRIAHELGDQREVAGCLVHSGITRRATGDADAAWMLEQEAASIAREVNDTDVLGAALLNLADIALLRGDPNTAETYCNESLIALEERGTNTDGIAACYLNLAHAALEQGHPGAAFEQLVRLLDVALETGNKPRLAECLEVFAALYAAVGRAERAGCLVGAAEALRDSMNTVLEPFEQKVHARTLSLVRRQIGDEAVAVARAAGRGAPVEDLLADAVDGWPAAGGSVEAREIESPTGA